MKARNDLALALGIPTEPVLHQDHPVPAVIPEAADEADLLSEQDFHLARKNIKKAIETGEVLIDAMREVAMQSDAARVFEVATDLMRGFVEINEKLVDLHARRMNAEVPLVASQPTTVNNLTIVGTTDEILRKIIEAKKAGVPLIEHNEAV